MTSAARIEPLKVVKEFQVDVPIYIICIFVHRYICDAFQSFVVRHRLLTERLIKKGFWYKLCKCFKKFVRRHNALFSKYGIRVKLGSQYALARASRRERHPRNILFLFTI